MRRHERSSRAPRTKKPAITTTAPATSACMTTSLQPTGESPDRTTDQLRSFSVHYGGFLRLTFAVLRASFRP
jgi:hypothetical protein